jgi:cellulose synthase/poly-beta-1,6-N-acetylglucosamine synthase-like glycosyltransferase
MEFLFWALLGTAGYVYVGYPALLWLIAALGGARPVRKDACEPAVTLVISAYNEERVIGQKLENSLALDYPAGQLQVIVVSDCSSDATDEIVRGWAARNVELLRMGERSGKTLGLNQALERARGEIVVFSDANAMYRADALRRLVRNFADPQVGAVVGESGYSDAQEQSERSEGLYWRYETAIKRLESSVGSTVGGDGAIYAVRRRLYVPMRADALSDFVNPLQIVRSGHRCIYEPEALSFERAGNTFEKEFRRKVRIVNRAWRATMSMRELLNPLRYGFFAWQLISHKLLRWLMPFWMLGLLVVNAILVPSAPVYAALFGAQLLFYALAIAGHLSRNRSGAPRIMTIPYFFCLVNLASALGIIDVYRGRTYVTWTTVRT